MGLQKLPVLQDRSLGPWIELLTQKIFAKTQYPETQVSDACRVEQRIQTIVTRARLPNLRIRPNMIAPLDLKLKREPA